MAGSGNCRDCGGSGKVSISAFLPGVICSRCNGSGCCQVCGGSTQCNNCNGTGKISISAFLPNVTCSECNGSGDCQTC